MSRKDPRFDPEFQKTTQQKRESTNKIEGKEIGNTTILTEHLANGSITSEKLSNGSVTNSKLANDSITADKIATGAVSTSEINTSAEPTVSTIYSNNWFRSNGATGWYNQTYGGGIWMEDSKYVKVYNGKAFMPSAGSGDNGIIFPLNPGNGTGDIASIKYYVLGGESTMFEIKVENDTDDRIDVLSSGRIYMRGRSAATTGSATIITSANGLWTTDWPDGWTGGLSTYDISCAGLFTNDVRYRSDRRHKENIKTIESALNKICKLNPVSFEWKPEFYSNSNKQHGFIAQEVEMVIPELVDSDTNGFKTLQSLGLIPYLVKSLQEQQIQIESQRKIIENLEARLNLIEDLLK